MTEFPTGNDWLKADIPEALRRDIAAHGWQVAPNNIHGLAGWEICPTGPGSWQTKYPQSVRFVNDSYVVLAHTHTGEPYQSLQYHHHEIARFTTAADLLAWLHTHGEQSLGGLPAFINGWD